MCKTDIINFISIIIPSRNEERFIGKCLNSIIANDYPKAMLEVLVVDGMSEDTTMDVVRKYHEKYPWIKLLDNHKRITPAAFNRGIEFAKGDIIMILGAHSTIEKDYISKCARYLNENDADNVGGIWKILPQNNTLVAESIAHTLSSPFGVGNAYYRIGSNKPRYVDTVWGGCYKKKVFDKIGLFNEELTRGQDIDLNLRLKRGGGKILLFPDIVSYYYARSTLKALAGNSFWNGFWVIYSTKFAKTPFSFRHLVPLFFILASLGSLFLSRIYTPFIYLFTFVLGLYLIINILFSFRISLANKLRLFPALIISFFTLHFWYGVGSIWGLIKLLVSKRL